MQNGKPLDLSAHVERVRRRTRPWKAIIALLLAIAAAIISHEARTDPNAFGAAPLANQWIANGSAVLFLIFGSIATYAVAGKVRDLLEPKTGTAHAAIARYAILIVGAFTTLVITLELFAIPVGQLVLGGALTSVFVGIAAQQALSNVFAGLVLVIARPFRVGDAIRFQAGALGGTVDGIVTDIGITYVRVSTDGTVMSIPNSQVLNAVVGPIPPEEEESPQQEGPPEEEGPPHEKGPPAVTDSQSGTPGGPEQPAPRPAGPV